jgi:hypothetical protein
VCQGCCRDNDLYHQTVYRTVPAQQQDDGSIYFNYLRFANSSSRTSPCTNSSTYEPVTRGRGAQPTTSALSRLGRCFRKPRLPTTDADHRNTQHSGHQKGAPRDWKKIKRLLLLAGVLLGILVALGGIVVGFLLLSPSEPEGGCEEHVAREGKGALPLLLGALRDLRWRLTYAAPQYFMRAPHSHPKASRPRSGHKIPPYFMPVLLYIILTGRCLAASTSARMRS